MTKFLLDVNVLVAVIDPLHAMHERAMPWFLIHCKGDWATCPITENGAVRIVSQPTYANPQPSPPIEIMRELTEYGRHHFIPDNISILDEVVFNAAHVLSPKQITDTYLLALAAKHDSVLATLDRHIVTLAVRLPNARVHLI